MLGVLGIIVSAILGYLLVAHLVPAPAGFFRHVLRLSLGSGVGLGILSAAFFILRAAGLTAKPAAWVSLVALAVASSVLLAQRPFPRSFVLQPASQREDKFLVGCAGVCAVLGFIINIAIFAPAIWARPSGDFDALAVWNLRARFLTLTDATHFRDAFSPALIYAHTDYPLLVPGSIAQMWSLSGDFWWLTPMLVAAVFFLSMPAVMLATFSCLGRHFQGCAAALATLGGSWYAILAANQYADVPMSFFVAGTICSVYLGFTTGSTRPFLMAGLCAGLAAWTKNEGYAFCLVALATIAMTIIAVRGEACKRRLLMLNGGAAAILWVVVIYKLAFAGPGDPVIVNAPTMAQRFHDQERLLYTATSFAVSAPSFLHWVVFPLFPLLAVLPFVGVDLRRGNGISAIIAAVTVCLMVPAYFIAYIASPYNLHWLVAFSVDRLFLQIWPAALMVLVVIMKPPTRAAIQ